MKKRKTNGSAVACLLAVLLGITVLAGVSPAFAVSAGNVLDDLSKDPAFSIADYPEIPGNYSLQVIQIAETTADELMVYVYQPSGREKDLRASSINISTAIGDSLHYVNYPLEQIDAADTLYKYRVKDLAVKKDALRYYAIASIFRLYDPAIDSAPPGDNTIDEVSYAVAQDWTACTVAGEVSYNMTILEVITVTEKHVGFVRYSNGFKLYEESCDAHYIAFNTDRNMDHLLEADVSFVTRHCTYTYSIYHGDQTICDDPVDRSLTLNYTDVASNPADGLFGKKYTWNRIETVSDFVKNETLTDETKTQMANKKWVLRFYESPYTSTTGMGSVTSSEFTRVTEVTILRLKFETNGKVYDLGVVDNKQSGDLNPDNKPDGCGIQIPWWVWVILVVVVLLIVVCIVIPLLPAVCTFLGFVFKAVFWIISLPFRFIAWLIRKIRGVE